jgi:hypothetical protein
MNAHVDDLDVHDLLEVLLVTRRNLAHYADLVDV